MKTVVRDYADLFRQDRSEPHWAYDYARRLAGRVSGRPVLIQTSMSPSGPFHVGNFRDTACAHLVHRALRRLGRESVILLSFDDFDPVRPDQAARQPELAGYAARPLAAVTRSTHICRRYIAELKRAGICPDEADDDGRTPQGSAWMTHYQNERYLAGTYVSLQRRYQRHARTLAGLLGASGPRNLFSVYCEQCGRGTTEILRLERVRVRYACGSCGAVTTTERTGIVKPSWALDWTLRVTHEGIDCEPAGQDHCSAGSTMDRTRVVYHRFLRGHQPVIVPYGLVRQGSDRRKVSGSRGGGITLGDLLDVMPAPMVLWLYGRLNCLSDFRINLARPGLLAAYAEYDRFLEAVRRGDRRASALHELITDGPPPAPLPPMRTVLGLLHGLCYDADLVTAALHGSAQASTPQAGTAQASTPRASTAQVSTAQVSTAQASTAQASTTQANTTQANTAELRLRVLHGRAWLARHGSCWIDGVRESHPDASGLLGTGGDLRERWNRDAYRTLYLTLFDTEDGPPLRRLEQVFGAAALADAVRTQLGTGRRPLREQVLSRLRPGDHHAR